MAKVMMEDMLFAKISSVNLRLLSILESMDMINLAVMFHLNSLSLTINLIALKTKNPSVIATADPIISNSHALDREQK